MEIIIGCIILALIISGAIMFFVRSKLKSVRSERTACNYTRGGSFRTTASHDRFLFNRITRIPRAQNNNSGGGGKRRR
ncbi:MAG: hypothetical protein FWB80_14495 [Defluviitaleaceae bacterium]|nr:hypothetical protein [Defluviitaleaceae bacterium]